MNGSGLSYEEFRDAIAQARAEQDKIDKRNRLANMVPKIFVIPSINREEAFDMEINGQWATDKYPRELLPVLLAYKSALSRELREAEYYIQYLQGEGRYPLGKISIKVDYEGAE